MMPGVYSKTTGGEKWYLNGGKVELISELIIILQRQLMDTQLFLYHCLFFHVYLKVLLCFVLYYKGQIECFNFPLLGVKSTLVLPNCFATESTFTHLWQKLSAIHLSIRVFSFSLVKTVSLGLEVPSFSCSQVQPRDRYCKGDVSNSDLCNFWLVPTPPHPLPDDGIFTEEAVTQLGPCRQGRQPGKQEEHLSCQNHSSLFSVSSRNLKQLHQLLPLCARDNLSQNTVTEFPISILFTEGLFPYGVRLSYLLLLGRLISIFFHM